MMAVALVENTVEMDGSPTPREVAGQFWSEVKQWVESGYLPVVHVTIDGTPHEIDLGQ